jgi:ectoine hydroxylase-related dioxygenase (phytanoyl-CoA dioxygenase family)
LITGKLQFPVRTAKQEPLEMLRIFEEIPSTDELVDVLEEDGAAVILNMAEHNLLDQIEREIRQHLEANRYDFKTDFNGQNTLRVATILAVSRTAAKLVAHPLVLELADAVLSPYCDNYRLNSSDAIEIHPGETAQKLHRDEDDLYPIINPEVEYQISAMWALSDFTRENGATQLVLRSHRKNRVRSFTDDDVIQAVMPKGALLVYQGSTIHGGGANVCDVPRLGLISTYNLGWLRQEENLYLSIPREIADSYPERIRRLIGYQVHGGTLGLYPGDPDDWWTRS